MDRVMPDGYGREIIVGFHIRVYGGEKGADRMIGASVAE